jgi:hypothetical protein
MKEPEKGSTETVDGSGSKSPPAPWSVRLAGGAALVGSLVIGATAAEVLLATAGGMGLAELARSRVTVKRLRRDVERNPDRDLRSLTGQHS